MTQQLIDLDTVQPGGKKGDPLRSAFGKTNENFTELYARTASASAVLAGLGDLANKNESDLNLSDFMQRALNLSDLLDADEARENLGINSQPWTRKLVNKIINGNMFINQRGTDTFTNVQGGYTIDRWYVSLPGALAAPGVYNVLRLTYSDLLPTYNFYILRLAASTPDPGMSTSANRYAGFEYKIEGMDVEELIGEAFTLSFDVRASVPGTYHIGFRNAQSDRSYVVPYTINTANLIEHKTITVPGGLITDGTWDWANGRGLCIFWTAGIGAQYVTNTTEQWVTGNYVAGPGQANAMGVTNGIFDLANVQLIKSNKEMPIMNRPVVEELLLCERYFHTVSPVRCSGVTYTPNGDTRAGFPTRARMRIAPTATDGGSSTSIVCCGTTTSSVVNVALGNLSYTTSPSWVNIVQISNYAALAAAGTVVAWGNANGIVVKLDAEL